MIFRRSAFIGERRDLSRLKPKAEVEIDLILLRRTVEWDLAHLPDNFPMYPIDYAAEDSADASRLSASS
jgi:hypothetical protein